MRRNYHSHLLDIDPSSSPSSRQVSVEGVSVRNKPPHLNHGAPRLGKPSGEIVVAQLPAGTHIIEPSFDTTVHAQKCRAGCTCGSNEVGLTFWSFLSLLPTCLAECRLVCYRQQLCEGRKPSRALRSGMLNGVKQGRRGGPVNGRWLTCSAGWSAGSTSQGVSRPAGSSSGGSPPPRPTLTIPLGAGR